MSEISWLAVAFILIPCCTLIVFGRLADITGFKRHLVAGFIFFGLSSILFVTAARGLTSLVALRCMQGLGNSLLMSITYAMINRAFPAHERGRALGVNTIFVSLGYAIGPSVSGFLLEYFSWRSIFIVNIPFCALGIVMALIVIKDNPQDRAANYMDWPGSLLLGAFIGFLVVAINFSSEWGVLSRNFLVCVALGLVALAKFIRRETRISSPLIELSLFRDLNFTYVNIILMLAFLAQQMMYFLVPFFLINILLMPTSNAGFVVLATPLCIALLAPVGGGVADRFGSKLPATFGLLIYAAGCFILSQFTDTSPLMLVVPGLMCFGIGNALTIAPLNNAIFSTVPKEFSGVASGLASTMRNLGQVLGVAFCSAIMTARKGYHGFRLLGIPSGGEVSNQVYILAQRDTFYFGVFVMALALFCLSRLRLEKKSF
jgi:EmrB/QacA subfamily drug resistance transporter